MAEVVHVTSLPSAFELSLTPAAGGQRDVRVSKLQVADAALAREVFRARQIWFVVNHDALVKLERVDAILRVLGQLLLPRLAADPNNADLLRSLSRTRSKLSNCVESVGGSFLAVGNRLMDLMKQVENMCSNNEHSAAELRAAVDGLAARVDIVRGTDVQLGGPRNRE